MAGFTNNVNHIEIEIDPALLEVIGLPAEQLEPIRTVIVNEVEKAQEALQIKLAA
jgi:hypothetical protein